MLSPAERAQDPLWRMVLDHEGPAELDLGEALDGVVRVDAIGGVAFARLRGVGESFVDMRMH